MSILEAQALRLKVRSNKTRLGWFVSRDGEQSWVNGHEESELKVEREALKERKQKLEQKLKEEQVAQDFTFGRKEVDPIGQHQASESESRLKWLLGDLERKDDELQLKQAALKNEKQAHIRASKRVESEGSSKLSIGQKVRCFLFLFIFNLSTSCLIFTYQNSLCSA